MSEKTEQKQLGGDPDQLNAAESSEVLVDTWAVDATEDLPEDEPFAPLEFEIVNYPADTTLKGYLDQKNSGQLKIPPFQREYVWDVRKASKLIESFLLGLPVPGVFLFKAKRSNEFQIIDGQQRIFSVIRFLDEKFDESIFRLKGVQDKYEGMKFSDFDKEIQFKLETTVLRATIIQQLSPDDDRSIYQIFERLNTGGINLNPMEVRQSVSYGPFVELLKNLNTSEDWRRILGQPKTDKRLRDVELILRLLALNFFYDNYDKPMKEFLNRYMEKKRREHHDYKDLENQFLKAAHTIFSQLGEKPFHLRSRLNYGALDSVFCAVLSAPDVVNLPEKFKNLTNDIHFQNSVSFNTSDQSVIDLRLAKARQYIR
jgi:uncharacterized protein with ParB-like and HNH nuclease domain